jgi:TM2 domain-containing membrane protein YozV
MAKQNGLFKEPWLAANLSLLVPGAGQFYARAWLAGGIYLGVAVVLCLVGAILHAVDALPWYVAVPIAMGLAGTWIASVPNAHRRAREQNTPIMEQTRKRAKDPFLSAMLGRLVPGAGHLYCGQMGLASALLMGTIALAALFVVLGWGWVFFAVYPAYAAGVCLLSWLAGPEDRRTSVMGVLVLAAGVTAAGLLVHCSILLTHRQIQAQRLLQQRMAAREDGSGSPAAIGPAPWENK